MTYTKLHFIGIGGIGMSGLARIMLAQNIHVSGSDLSANHITEGLINAGAHVSIGQSAQNIASANTTVIYSSDIKKDNPEYQQALKLNCPLLHRSDLLALLMQQHKSLAVTGTHGKTTTSALLTAVLSEAGQKPSFAIGGIVPQFQTNAAKQQGEYFVAEADESDGTFLKYHPFGAIITNIDFDHMNHFLTESALITAFHQFATQVTSPQHLFWCGDDARLSALKLPGISYGFGAHCDLCITSFTQVGWNIHFDIEFKKKKYSDIQLSLIGRHNALNAAAVFGLALSLGLSEQDIRKAFISFGGVMRRCEKKAELQGVLFLDDYAHHPTEIKTTLDGIRKATEERRLIAVFQPHRYSRTKDCLGTYKNIFDAADELFITDIYASGETPIPGLSHQQIIEEIQLASKLPCQYVPRSDLINTISSHLLPHDVVVTLGAGDITKLGTDIAEKLKRNPIKKLQVGIIFGGCSVEHEISLISSRHVTAGLQNQHEYYDIVDFGISKQGSWLTGKDVLSQLDKRAGQEKITHQKVAIPSEVLEKLLSCDIFFPVLHGTFGEDGTIQGFFEILGKPYVGCDHRSSAICMDKTMTKKLVLEQGIDTSPFVNFSFTEWKSNESAIRDSIRKKLIYPLFVKPTHLGSSVGVTKILNENELTAAVDKAFDVDTQIVVENGIVGREIEFAVLGNDHITVFPPGEILTKGAVYDYDAKYGPDGIQAVPCAVLSQELKEKGMVLAKRAFIATGCQGMARVDFFLDSCGKFWFNEINTIPGFTAISLYPQICREGGIPIAKLVDRLIILALQRKRFQARHT